MGHFGAKEGLIITTDDKRGRAGARLREARGLVEQLGEAEREALQNIDSAIVDLLPDDGRGAERRRAAALAQARELQEALRGLAALREYGGGSCPAYALEALDEVLGYLEPDDEDDEPPQRPRLRLVGRS